MQRFSAALIDESMLGLDRELLMAVHDAGSAPIVVTRGISRRQWESLGASACIAAGFEADELLHVLRAWAEPLDTRDRPGTLEPAAADPDRRSRSVGGGVGPGTEIDPAPVRAPLVAVLGAGGSGTSTVAIALAQAFGSIGSRVTLLDASLDASLALMVGSTGLVPSLQHLVELHRLSSPTGEDLRPFLHPCPDHGFALVPGLRRHRDWTSLGDHAVAATIASLRHCSGLLIADIDPDLEGESETGSFDIADRNSLSRRIAMGADVVVVTGRPDLVGVSRIVRILADLIELGVETSCIRTVVLRPARTALSPAEIRRSLDHLLLELRPSLDPPPTSFLDLPKGLDALMLDALPLPGSFVDSMRSIVEPVLGSGWSTPATSDPVPRPAGPRSPQDAEPIVPGSLGIAS